MILLIKDYKAQIENLNTEIQQINTALNIFKSHTKFEEINSKLNSDLEIYNRQILINDKKFERDKRTFIGQNAYNWERFRSKRFNTSVSQNFPKNSLMDVNTHSLSDSSSISQVLPQSNRSRALRKRRASVYAGSGC